MEVNCIDCGDTICMVCGESRWPLEVSDPSPYLCAFLSDPFISLLPDRFPCSHSFFLKKDFIYWFIFGERDREGERKRGREALMRERNMDRLPLTWAPTGTEPTTQACALTGNWTGNLFLCGTMCNQLSHTGQGVQPFLKAPSQLFIDPLPMMSLWKPEVSHFTHGWLRPRVSPVP